MPFGLYTSLMMKEFGGVEGMPEGVLVFCPSGGDAYAVVISQEFLSNYPENGFDFSPYTQDPEVLFVSKRNFLLLFFFYFIELI